SAVLADRGFAPACTLYLGESLGTGVAARLARTHPPAGIVLRSPYPRFADVARANFPWLPADLILRDRYPLADDLAGSPVPVVVLAGRADELVPVALSAQVAESVPNLHREVILDGARHNDGVWQSDVVGAEVTDLADAATGACS
ncbi:MAG: alpha/beta hydrolase, partial [Propionibacteriaceae bacterium]|nr:alpha/beta hydrolase [Propionibacteriaceae bacterium]